MEYWEICGWFSWITPIIGAMLIPLLSKIGSKIRDYGSIFFSFLAMIFTVSLLPLLFQENISWPLHSTYSWIPPLQPFRSGINIGIMIDPLSIIVANVVSIISFLIAIYSLGYMHGDPSLTRYWFFIDLFIGNMLLLVLSDNLIQMLFGWEGVGLCSYALIGFWYRDSRKDWLKCWVGEGDEAYPPSHCGLKAFIVTRLGDVIMLIGAFIILSLTGTLNFIELSHINLDPGQGWLILIALILLFFGPIGKSAQLPLMEWIPDAMAGPTTVSALIHAATMVKAGVYLTARLFPIIFYWSINIPQLSLFFIFVMWIGVLTAFIAALQAIVSTELKKVLAYSTISQLGYMMMALGAGGISDAYIIGYTGGVFHLISHAMFKASLFLAAGSVLHSVGSRFLRHFSGLRKDMPYTFTLMSIAALSLMGAPFITIGFWSKDMTIESTLISGQYIAFGLGILTAFLTAFYTTRMISLTFLGKKGEFIKEKEKKGHRIHESPMVMIIPVAILVLGTVIFGISGFYLKDLLEHIFHVCLSQYIPVYGKGSLEGNAMLTMLLSIIVFFLGISLGYIVYVSKNISSEIVSKSPLLTKTYNFILHRMYLNRLYYIVANGVIIGAGKILHFLEIGIIDKANYLTAEIFVYLSRVIRYLHTGMLNYNIIGMLLGILILIALLLSLGG